MKKSERRLNKCSEEEQWRRIRQAGLNYQRVRGDKDGEHPKEWETTHVKKKRWFLK